MSELLQVEYVRRRERLLPARAALLVVDVQDKLLAAMPAEIAAQLVKHVTILVAAAARHAVPIVVSQQYPKGLGVTVPEVVTALTEAEARGVDVYRFDKLQFSAAACDEFRQLPVAQLSGPLMEREQWIVCGMETHVCVYQTVRDLIGPACAAHVVADAVASRTKANWRLGLQRCRDSGAVVTSTEIVVFDLLERAGTDAFKDLSRRIR